jgi:hypothetical protein
VAVLTINYQRRHHSAQDAETPVDICPASRDQSGLSQE